MAYIIIVLGVIYFLAHFLSWFFEKTRVPDVLILMVLGIILGPVFGVVTTADFGQVGPVVTTIALIIILFESGTTLDLRAMAAAMGSTLLITLSTFVLTVAAVAGLSKLVLGYSWMVSALLGTILGGTSSAVVIPMVTGLRLSEKPAAILVVESALTDVLCIILTLGLLEGVLAGEVQTGRMVGGILASLGFAMLIGVLGALVWLLLLEVVRRFPNTMFTTFAYTFVLYGITELLGFSGAIAALAFGAMMANYQRIPVMANRDFPVITDTEKSLYREMVFMLKTFFFLFLGISIPFGSWGLAVMAVVMVAVVYFLRLVVTRVMLSRRVAWNEAAIVSVMVPKGLAAAVLAGLPAQAGLAEGASLQTLVYLVVLASIVATAVLVPLIGGTGLAGVYRGLFKPFAETPVP